MKSTVFLFILLGSVVSQLAAFSFPTSTTVAYALPDMSPSDGDTWTESSSSTFTWTTPFSNDTIELTTEMQYVGANSLKVSHTSNTTSVSFRLDLKSEQDFSGYDAIAFWLFLQGKRSSSFSILAGSSLPSYNRYAFRLGYFDSFDNVTWIRVVVPLNAFFASIGSPSWSRVQYIEFQDAYRTANDNTTLYLDGLRFTDFEAPILSENENDILLPNFFYAVSKFGDKRIVYNHVAYNTLYAYLDIGTGAPSNYVVEGLESQSLGQTLFALATAYNVTKSVYLKTKIDAYTLWIDRLRSQTQYKGIRNYFFNNSIAFSTSAETLQNGWVLAGVSYMYNITGETIYKNIADDIRTMLVDQLWNSTTNWFNKGINTENGGISTYSWRNDIQGSAVLGLSAYYRLVSANETVRDCVQKCLNTQLTKPFSSAHEAFTSFNFEYDSYMHWGYYEAYKAFHNDIYWKYALAQSQINLAYNMVYLNGSMGYRNNFVPMSQDSQYGYLDEWGATSSLLLLLFLNEETGDSKILQSFRKTMFDHIAMVKTSLWLVSRYRNAPTSSYEAQFNTKSWQPTQAFIYTSLVKYYYNEYRPLRPFPLLSTQEVKAVQWTPQTAPLWNSVTEVSSDGGNATVLMYVPYDNETEKPFPNDYWQHYINDAIQWGSHWDAPNRILNLWAFSGGPFRIVLERESTPPVIRTIEKSPDGPEYKDEVEVKANITDDRSGVRGAILSHNRSSVWTNATMTLDGAFYAAVLPRSPYGSVIAFKVLASDNAANWVETETFTYIVGDRTPPTIAFRELTVKSFSSYDEILIEVQVIEPSQASGVANATLWFKVDDGSWHSEQVTRTGLWSGSVLVQVQKGVKILQYYAEAYDKAGNKATSETYNYALASDQSILGLPIPVFAGIIIAAVGLTGFLVYILRARRSKTVEQKKTEK